MLSMPHIIVLFVIALVVFGPEKLPELARMLGKATAEFRRITTDFRYTLEDEVRDLERQARIHQEEIAAAARAVEPPQAPPVQAPPDGTQPRELPAVEPSVEPPAEQQANHSSSAEAVKADQEPVTPPHEKSTDDHAV
jgi:TatA/E family protein of Tat protein translocase